MGCDSYQPGNVDDVVWDELYTDEVDPRDDNVDVIDYNTGTGTPIYSEDLDGHGGKVKRYNELRNYMTGEEQT